MLLSHTGQPQTFLGRTNVCAKVGWVSSSRWGRARWKMDPEDGALARWAARSDRSPMPRTKLLSSPYSVDSGSGLVHKHDLHSLGVQHWAHCPCSCPISMDNFHRGNYQLLRAPKQDPSCYLCFVLRDLVFVSRLRGPHVSTRGQAEAKQLDRLRGQGGYEKQQKHS